LIDERMILERNRMIGERIIMKRITMTNVEGSCKTTLGDLQGNQSKELAMM
jgi:hypothetical protein